MMFSTNLLTTAVLLAGAATATTHKGEMMGASASAMSIMASATNPGVAAGTGAAGAGGEKVHVVQVGQNMALKFEPSNVKAAVGDLVQFQFWPKNHSVVQAAFASPCTPIQNVMSNVTNAFFSGFMPTMRNATAGQGSGALTYTVRVTSAAPMWYYCSQGKHCQEGMVGAINSPESSERSVAQFIEKAKVATANLSPGQMGGGAAGGAGGAAGGNSTGLGSAQPSGGAGGAGGAGDAGSTLATAAGGATATPSAPTNAPAQQTANGSPDRLVENAMTGVAGIFGAAVAFFLL